MCRTWDRTLGPQKNTPISFLKITSGKNILHRMTRCNYVFMINIQPQHSARCGSQEDHYFDVKIAITLCINHRDDDDNDDDDNDNDDDESKLK